MGKEYLAAMRPHQWAKNILVFIPIAASHIWTVENLVLGIWAFVSLSAVASSSYIINDLLDVEADRAHPRKRLRPFASGAISLPRGAAMAVVLLLVGIMLAFSGSPALAAVVAAYFAGSVLYSTVIKRLLLLDIWMLAALYTTRIVAGGVATGIGLSVWLLAFSLFLFLSLAAIKRQAELVDSLGRGREKIEGRGYQTGDLAIVSQIVLAAAFSATLVLALYINTSEVQLLYQRPEVLWGVCAIILYWNCRLAFLTARGEMHDDPVVFAIKDRVSQICGLCVAGLIAFGALG